MPPSVPLTHRKNVLASALSTKTRITARFIQRKRTEYDAVKDEFGQLTAKAEPKTFSDF